MLTTSNMELATLFESLKLINNPGIYRLVSIQEKKCYISYSSNIAGALNRLLSSNLYFDKFDFEILEIVTDPVNLRPRCQYFKDLYSSNGYAIINPRRVCNLKVVVDIVRLPDRKWIEDIAISVKIVSSGFRELIVGLFYDHVEVDEFLQKYYPDNLVTSIVYANNDLTLEYRKNDNS